MQIFSFNENLNNDSKNFVLQIFFKYNLAYNDTVIWDFFLLITNNQIIYNRNPIIKVLSIKI